MATQITKTKAKPLGEFCPCTCTMKELVSRIKKTKNAGQILESKFLEGVRHCRVVLIAATNGEVGEVG